MTAGTAGSRPVIVAGAVVKAAALPNLKGRTCVVELCGMRVGGKVITAATSPGAVKVTFRDYGYPKGLDQTVYLQASVLVEVLD